MEVDTANPTASDGYLVTVRHRLAAAGFVWTDAVGGDEGSFLAVARRTGFQPTKFGMWETFFVFRDFQRLDAASMRSFMSDAVRNTFANRAVKLPRGLFAGLATFAVALADDVDVGAARAVREEAPPKHWAANDIPVIYDARARRVHCYEKTPVWGAAYYRGFRKQIDRFLAP